MLRCALTLARATNISEHPMQSRQHDGVHCHTPATIPTIYTAVGARQPPVFAQILSSGKYHATETEIKQK